ncbi:MAG TPA: hypothetical protein VM487_17675 [Phycisphaerae bacterium]|nr:hypothetical protein [Phycisphaerae bacterium]
MTGKTLRLRELHPKAADWIDAGRREIRRQIKEYIERVCQQPGRRLQYSFPMETRLAMTIVAGLGYDAERRHMDYFIRHGRMQLPPKNGKRLAWDIENVIDLAMQLERMRYWRPGCHDEKKTCWELQAEFELHDVACDTANGHEVQELDIDEMLGTVIDASSVELHAEAADSCAAQRGETDAVVEALLNQAIDEPSASRRKTLGCDVPSRAGRGAACQAGSKRSCVGSNVSARRTGVPDGDRHLHYNGIIR